MWKNEPLFDKQVSVRHSLKLSAILMAYASQWNSALKMLVIIGLSLPFRYSTVNSDEICHMFYYRLQNLARIGLVWGIYFFKALSGYVPGWHIFEFTLLFHLHNFILATLICSNWYSQRLCLSPQVSKGSLANQFLPCSFSLW